MRIRRLLLAHTSRSLRALIKKYLLAELNDIEITESEGLSQALSEMELRAFDLLITPSGMLATAPAHLSKKLAEKHTFSGTPVILLSDEENRCSQDPPIEGVFQHVVHIRTRPADLIDKINLVCNPRRWRAHRRFHIPGAAVELRAQEERVKGSLINISRGGLLLELTTQAPWLLMSGQLRIRLHLPERLPAPDDLSCRMLRINVMAWHADETPSAMRATCIFVPGQEEKIARMERILLANEDQ